MSTHHAAGAAAHPPLLSADRVDRHVGARIRQRRYDLGVSQSTLADAIGLTFQQVQKYERGANRVSASKLHQIATVLRTTVAWFFDGLPGDASAGGDAIDSETDRMAARFAMTPGAQALMAAWPDIPAAPRRRLLALAAELAGDPGDPGEPADDDDATPALAAPPHHPQRLHA